MRYIGPPAVPMGDQIPGLRAVPWRASPGVPGPWGGGRPRAYVQHAGDLEGGQPVDVMHGIFGVEVLQYNHVPRDREGGVCPALGHVLERDAGAATSAQSSLRHSIWGEYDQLTPGRKQDLTVPSPHNRTITHNCTITTQAYHHPTTVPHPTSTFALSLILLFALAAFLSKPALTVAIFL
jgi:hypothetical protein